MIGQSVESANPFSTRFVRPGAIPFVFRGGESAAAIVSRLRAARWRGQIVGPHGSGKSTLLASLLPALVAAGRQPVSVRLCRGERRLPAEFHCRVKLNAATQLVIDGYEQLGWLARLRLWWLCRQYGCGLLATTHRPAKLTTVAQTNCETELAVQLVERICAGRVSLIHPAEACEALAAHEGNMREALFALYDLYASRNVARSQVTVSDSTAAAS